MLLGLILWAFASGSSGPAQSETLISASHRDTTSLKVIFKATGGSVSRRGLFTAGPDAGGFRIVAELGELSDTATVRVSVPPVRRSAGLMQFGAYELKPDDFGEPFNTSVVSLSPDYAWDLLDGLKAKGAKVIVNFAGGSFKNVQNPDGTFSYDRWKARVDRFLPDKQKIQSYIDAGTLVGFMMVDEPHSEPSWGGHAIPFSTIEEMAEYSKSLWPALTTSVRANPTWLARATFTWQYLDAGWAQYSVRKGDIESFTKDNVEAGRRAGLGVIGGLNVLDGGNGSSGRLGTYAGAHSMSAAELRTYGSVLVANPYVCSFHVWKYDPDYMSLPDIRAAFAALAEVAKAEPHEPCRVR
jgi:hypothetical protein